MANPDITLAQRRALITTQINKIQIGLTIGNFDHIGATLRFAKTRELYERYDTAVDELEMTNPESEEVTLADGVRTLYYSLAAQLHTVNQTNTANNSLPNPNMTANTSVANTTATEPHRRAKLPTTELPKFYGNFENWLSFRNEFQTMMKNRDDVTELDKFIYLRGLLIVAASHKLALFDASAENYQRAWDLLTDTYQKERPLAWKHYDALLNLNFISDPTNENLTKLIDDARQHLNCLETIKARPTEAFVVRVLELKLPAEIRDEWEETFDDDNTLPTFELFGKFMTKTAFRLSTRKPDPQTNTFKRRRDQTGNPRKFQRTEHTTRTLVTTVSRTCTHCKGTHPIYKCPDFNALTVDQRVKFVKSARLCQNCLRDHKGACNSIKCKTCNKFHHTMLHYPRNATNQSTRTTMQKTETPTAAATADKSATA